MRLERFVSKGGLFTVMSSRSIESVGRFVEWIPLSAPAILLGGAVIYDFTNKRFLKRYAISEQIGWLIDGVKTSIPSLGAELFCESGCCAVNMSSSVAASHLSDHTSFSHTDLEFCTQPVLKLRICCDKARGSNFCDAVKKVAAEDARGKKINLFFPEQNKCDVTAYGVNKSNAITELQQRMAVSSKNVAIIGYSGDETANNVGMCCAVENADSGVKNRADVMVETCSRGGLAHFIEIVEKRYELE